MRSSYVKHLVVSILAAGIPLAPLVVSAEVQSDTKSDKLPARRLKVTISKETTLITEPLRPDGYPDYVRYVDEKLRQGVTPGNNVAVLLLEILGPREISEKNQAEFFKRLGIKPLPVKGDYLVDWFTYSQRTSAKDWPAVPRGVELSAKDYFESLDDFARRKPWTRGEFPALADWLKENDKHIDRLIAASKRPRMYTPLLTGDMDQTMVAVLLPVAQSSRVAARALVTRAMYRAGGGDFDGAVEDLMACHRLARATAQGFSLIEGLIAMAVDNMALEAETAIVAHDKLSAAQRAGLRKALDQLPAMRSMADALDQGERLMYLDSVCWIARSGATAMKQLTGMVGSNTPSGLELLADLAGDVLVDWDVPLRTGNEWYDRYTKAARIKDAKERLKALDAIEADVKRTAARAKDSSSLFGLFFSPRQAASQKMADVFIALLLPALNSALSAEHRNETKFSLVKLGLALADYRDDHKQFPDKLDDLAPKYVKEIPLDPMWGEPLVYKRTDNGYVLYGLGRNGQDDGGRNEDDGENADDLVITVPASTLKP